MHDAALRYVRTVLATQPLPAGGVLEIGARNINGSVRALFPGRPYLGIDAVAGEGVDVVASGATYVPAEAPAIIVCTETLEHTSEAETICRHAARILRPGGIFLLTAAGEGRPPHSATDGGALLTGEYYRNIHEPDLSAWLSDFDDVWIEINGIDRDIYATAIKRSR